MTVAPLALLLAGLTRLAAPDPVSLSTRTVRVPAPPGGAVAVEEEVAVLSFGADGGGEPQRLTIPRFAPAAGGAPGPVLEALNREARSLCLEGETLESWRAERAREAFHGLTGCSYRVLVNRGPFLAVTLCSEGYGAYPYVNCAQRRLRLDTGKPWAWTDAFLPARRKALLARCTAALERARAERARTPSDPPWAEAVKELGPEHRGLLRGACTTADLDAAERTPQGDLQLGRGGDLPHATQALALEFTLRRAELADLVDPGGPLGDLAGAH